MQDGAMYSGIIQRADAMSILAQTMNPVKDANFRKLNKLKQGIQNGTGGGGSPSIGISFWYRNTFTYDQFAKDNGTSDLVRHYQYPDAKFVIVQYVGVKTLIPFAGTDVSSVVVNIYGSGVSLLLGVMNRCDEPNGYPGGLDWEFQSMQINPTLSAGNALPRFDDSGTYLSDDLEVGIVCNANCDALTAGSFVVWSYLHLLPQDPTP